MPEITAQQWEAFLANYPDAHILQTRAWGELKTAFGWSAAYASAPSPKETLADLGTQVLFRRLPFGWNVAYIAKGPVGQSQKAADTTSWGDLLSEVDRLCLNRRSVFLKLEPDIWQSQQLGDQGEGHAHHFHWRGIQESQQSIQPRRTLVVDLTGDEEQVLSRMRQKTRYNIRLAIKKGLVAYPSTDLETFYRLMTETGQRDAFGVHSRQYYQRAHELFHPQGECVLLFAELRGQPLAALMAFAHGKRAWYFYGASSDAHREYMPTYLLQWEAMRWARARGCISYDLWGVPDEDLSTLEAQFTNRSDGLWGVYRFKRGFGGQLMRAGGPWDRVYQPLLYQFYRLWYKYRAQE